MRPSDEPAIVEEADENPKNINLVMHRDPRRLCHLDDLFRHLDVRT
jgi:hypothetical protein